MAISKKLLKNSRTLASNVQALKNTLTGKRALVLDRNLSGLNQISVKDYYHAVILETDVALAACPSPDIMLFSDSTPYRDNELYLDRYFSNESALFVLNYESVDVIRKLGREPSYFSLVYLPTSATIGVDASVMRQVRCGLNQDYPGVHLAKIMGCEDIYYTGTSPDSTNVDLSDIQTFVTEKDKLKPTNLVGYNRPLLINTIAV